MCRVGDWLCPYLAAFHGWGHCPLGSVSQLCVTVYLGDGSGKLSLGSLRCSGAGVSYELLVWPGLAGGFPCFVRLTL
jgi:hypothetical protein